MPTGCLRASSRRAGITIACLAVSWGFAPPGLADESEVPPSQLIPPKPPQPQPPEAPKPLPLDLWIGARTGLLAFGDTFYINQLQSPETTGNFLGPGIFGQADVGVRIAHQYIPYVAFEIADAPAGHRFIGQNAHASTFFAGVGFRYIARLVPRVGFAADLSFGLRRVTISDSTGSYSMQAWEIFRLGLGAEYRLSREWTLSPMVTISGGVMGQTYGHIHFAPGQGDGLTGPTFENGASVPTANIANYLDVAVGVGGHFDLSLQK